MGPFEKIFRSLNKEKVKYLVVGGVAVNLHGYKRFTDDLDLLLLLEQENLEKMSRVMKRLGYIERLPVSIKDLENSKQVKKWLKEKNMKAFSFFPPTGNPLMIDIIIEESLKFEKLLKNMICRKFGNIPVFAISIQDLIKMKRKAGRHKDLDDLEYLIAINNYEEKK